MLNLIDHLGADSHYTDAQAADEELAEQAAAAGHQPKARPPSLTEWSPEVRVLAAMHDRIGFLIGAVMGSAGAKPPKMEPYPRPVLAGQIVASRRRWAKHYALVDRIHPRNRETQS